LIIDFDLINNNLHSIFGVNKIPKDMKEKVKEEEFLSEFRLKEKNIQRLIVKVEKGIDIVSNANLIFDEEYILSKDGMQEMILELKRQYDIILIDTTQDTKYKGIVNAISELSTKIICLVGGNLIEIKKTITELKNNQKDKIYIIYNKKSKYTMNTKVLEMLFFKFEFLGVLQYDCKYDQIINKNINKLYISKKIRKEYFRIMEKLQIN